MIRTSSAQNRHCQKQGQSGIIWTYQFSGIFYLRNQRSDQFLPVIKVTGNKKIMNQRDPRVSVSPTVEEIISLKAYNNDCSKI